MAAIRSRGIGSIRVYILMVNDAEVTTGRRHALGAGEGSIQASIVA
jgi:hypothetical protein